MVLREGADLSNSALERQDICERGIMCLVLFCLDISQEKRLTKNEPFFRFFATVEGICAYS